MGKNKTSLPIMKTFYSSLLMINLQLIGEEKGTIFIVFQITYTHLSTLCMEQIHYPPFKDEEIGSK